MQNQTSLFQTLFFIFVGGGFGSILRYLVSVLTSKLVDFGKFPVGTFVVNIFGSFLIGFLLAKMAGNPQQYLKFLLVVGLCGGFTTFSTFSMENYQLLQNQQLSLLAVNVFLSVILGISAVFFGITLGKL